ncbi:acyl-CoA thioesterase II [Mycobacterium sp. DL592]|uniref:acyl-CoA thioesterase n=1 Tax=Mycobacterium sp. DL592 TaxID=2675524 RepID=UPI00141E91DA|nr:acyl-CoA thioesterase domain-containing protein [Mycobacterium sp. DL592]
MTRSSYPAVLAALSLHRVDATSFVGAQLPAPLDHILGGHLAAQALIAAARTAPARIPHSMHTYFLRAGDARRPVDFKVADLQEGRTFSARRISARQDGRLLLEAMTSFTVAVNAPDGVEYQPSMPEVPAPEGLPEPAPHFAESYEGGWASLKWFDRKVVDAGTEAPARSRIWWRPRGEVPGDPALVAAMVVYLSAVTLAEPVNVPRGQVGESAQRGHSVLFHCPADLRDWLLYDQWTPSSTGALALASGQMFNRTGELVCTVEQETYFPPSN